MIEKVITVRDALSQTIDTLRTSGFEEPHREARRLMVEACGLPLEHLISRPEKNLNDEQLARLAEFTKRVCQNEPLSRIVGRREFYGRDFELGPATLDPRPDTETVIELALDIIDAEGGRDRPLRILDVGTGTGVLLVTLLAELPEARGLATDISNDALNVAARNAERHGVADRAEFFRTSALNGINRTFDILVSNPPYILSSDIAGLSPAVRDYDPLAALDGGVDGHHVYRMIIKDLSDVVPSGWAIFEVGAGQADSVTDLLMTALGRDQIAEIQVRKDLGGHIRCVAAATHCS